MNKLHGAAFMSVVLALAGCDAPSPPQPPTDGGGIEIEPDENTPPNTSSEPAGDSNEPEGSTDDPTNEAPNCGEASVSLAFATPDVMLVLDKSGSMAANTWDHDRDDETPEITRWASLHQVVEDVTTDFDARMNLGAVLFPAVDAVNQSNPQACSMSESPEAPLSAGGGAAILNVLPGADSTEIFGGTPATQGVRLATDHLLERSNDNPKAIILITDGAANCSDGTEGADLFRVYDDALVTTVAASQTAGIPVHVVGIDIEDETLELPVANPWEQLSEVAAEGGAPRAGAVPFHDVFDELELNAALASIAQEVSCSVPFPESFDPERVSLSIDGHDVPLVEACDAGEGWTRAGTGARLCPDTCSVAQAAESVGATQSCIAEG